MHCHCKCLDFATCQSPDFFFFFFKCQWCFCFIFLVGVVTFIRQRNLISLFWVWEPGMRTNEVVTHTVASRSDSQLVRSWSLVKPSCCHIHMAKLSSEGRERLTKGKPSPLGLGDMTTWHSRPKVRAEWSGDTHTHTNSFSWPEFCLKPSVSSHFLKWRALFWCLNLPQKSIKTMFCGWNWAKSARPYMTKRRCVTSWEWECVTYKGQRSSEVYINKQENVVNTYNLKMVFSAHSVLYFLTFLAMNSSNLKDDIM